MELFEEELSGKKLISTFFFENFKKYKIQSVFLLLSIILSSSTLAIQPIIWSNLLTTLYENNFEQFKIVLMMTILFYFCKTIISYIQSRIIVYLKTNLVMDIQNRSYQRLLNKKMVYFDSVTSGKILSVLSTDIEQAIEITFTKLLPAIISFFQVILFLILMFRINVILTAFSILSLPIILIYYNKKMRNIRKQNVKVKDSNDSVLSFVQQSILGIKVIKSFGIKEVQCDQFIKLASIKAKNMYALQKFVLFFQTFISMLGVIVELSNYFIGGYFAFTGVITVEGFIQFSSYSQQLASSSLSITNIAGNYQHLLVILNRIESVRNDDNVTEIFGDRIVESTIESPPSLELVNVSCEKMGNVILENINLKIQRYGLYVIMGPSGSGKTTLVNHILKLYDVNLGEILINNKNINLFSERSLRTEITMVSQQVFSFSGSIIDNFRHVNPNIKLSDIRKYCLDCGIDNEIMGLPKQYQSPILENGNNFSVGQIQRLSVAIALAKETSIIVFDEPTSALDVENSIKIKLILEKIKDTKIVILVTHDHSITEKADIIFLLKKKQLLRIR